MTAKKKMYDAINLTPDSFQILERPIEGYGSRSKKSKIYSFFSGAGFLDLGFETQGDFDIRFVNEYCLPFVQTYRYSRVNLGIPEPAFGYSLADITWFQSGEKFERLKRMVDQDKEDGQPVGFIGGPPCPDFSVGGKNKGQHGENGKLSGTYTSLICRIQPDFFLFENVKGLYRTAKHRLFFEEMKKSLQQAGYVLTERLINALWYGAPQDRERILLVGFRKDSPRLGFDVTESIHRFPWSSNERPDAQKLKSLPWPEEGVSTLPPTGIPLELTVQHWFEKNKVDRHPNASHFFQPRAGLSKFKVIDEGDDKKKSYKRLHRWRYSPTAAYGNNEVHLHPYHARRISVSEALAIQSLPKDFLVPPSIPLSSMFKTIGNGVPYSVSKGIANTIATFISTQGKCI
jgi:DNA (cytosine-5)-methyltransferase 1